MTLSVMLRHSLPGFELDISFDAPPGVTVLFGRSGAGKTTIVNAVAGLIKPRSGRISIEDRVVLDTEKGLSLPPHKRRLGYVFQDARLFPHLSVRQNLLYGRWFAPESEPREAFDGVVDLLGIGSLLDRRPGMLSGGERQRVAIGRALLSSPQMILADEPLASLDEARKAELLPYFERLRDEARFPILYVSHSATEVARLATTVIALEKGKVIHGGRTSEVFSDPAIAAALGAREAGSILQARVLRHHDDGLTELSVSGASLFLPKLTAEPGNVLRIRINAGDVILSSKVPSGLSALNVLKARVLEIRPGSGPGAFVQLDIGGDTLLARITKRSVQALGIRPGMACYAVVKTVSVAPMAVGRPSMKDNMSTS